MALRTVGEEVEPSYHFVFWVILVCTGSKVRVRKSVVIVVSAVVAVVVVSVPAATLPFKSAMASVGMVWRISYKAVFTAMVDLSKFAFLTWVVSVAAVVGSFGSLSVA